MKASRIIVASAVFAAFACAAFAAAAEKRPGRTKPQPVKILNSWSGKLADAALRKHEPAGNFLLDREQWTTLWKAWRGQEAVPDVDFQKQMVLVFAADGPNSVGCEPTIDGQGNVQALAMSTLIGGPGFGYLIQCIPREGVRSVNGKPLPGEKAPAKKPRPKRPGGQPGAVPGSPGSTPPGEPGAAPSGELEIPPGGAPGVVASPPADEAMLPPMKQIENVVPKRAAFDGASVKKPLALKSEKEAAEHFDADELAKLAKQVDFERQFVLLFAWRGSGQDKLDAAVAESYPEQIFFSYRPGRTRDLREHVRIYALRSNVRWSVR